MFYSNIKNNRNNNKKLFLFLEFHQLYILYYQVFVLRIWYLLTTYLCHPVWENFFWHSFYINILPRLFIFLIGFSTFSFVFSVFFLSTISFIGIQRLCVNRIVIFQLNKLAIIKISEKFNKVHVKNALAMGKRAHKLTRRINGTWWKISNMKTCVWYSS